MHSDELGVSRNKPRNAAIYSARAALALDVLGATRRHSARLMRARREAGSRIAVVIRAAAHGAGPPFRCIITKQASPVGNL